MTREEAIYLLKNTAWLAPSLEPVDEAIDMAIKALEVDLVLCKECKYAHMTYGGECKYCDNWSLEDPLYLDGDFFCSYGERSRRKGASR